MDQNDKPSVPPVVAPAQDYSQAPSLQPAASPSSSDTLGGLIPTKNSASLVAYYCAVAGLVPCFAPICGPIAIIYGRKGLAAHRENPAVAGKTHSLVGIILGAIEILFALFLIGLIAYGAINAANSH